MQERLARVAAHGYKPMLDLVAAGTLKAGLLVTDVISLDEARRMIAGPARAAAE